MVRLHWRAGTKRALRGVDLSVVLSIVLWVGLNAPLAGWVRPDELPERYAVADVFAGPSVEDELGTREALGLVFAEALAAAVPVVTTDVGGIKDIVQDKVNGLVVPQRDARAIADALVYLRGHPKEATAMGERGQAFVRANFSWQSVAERYAKILGI